MEPISVIPDIGGAPNDYFMVRDWDNWKQAFSAWSQTRTIEHRVKNCDSGPVPSQKL